MDLPYDYKNWSCFFGTMDCCCFALSDGPGNLNLGFGFWKCHGEMDLWQVEQGFSSIFSKVENNEAAAKL